MRSPGGVPLLRCTAPHSRTRRRFTRCCSQNTIEAIRLGAADHLAKPISRDGSRVLLERRVAAYRPRGAFVAVNCTAIPSELLDYLYRRGAPANYVHSQFASDREELRGWLIRSLPKASGIRGSGLDTLLTALRETIRNPAAVRFRALRSVR